MSRTTSTLLGTTLLGMTLLVAVTMPVAQGQDATPTATQSANPSSSDPSANAAGTGPTGAPGTASAGQTKRADKGPPVCFKLTGRCVEVGGASQAASATTTAASPSTGTPSTKGDTATVKKGAPSQKGPLNLAAPDVRTVVSEDELKEPLQTSEEITEIQEAGTVSVKGESSAPEVLGGFGALWWALNHPSQAWRIFTPIE